MGVEHIPVAGIGFELVIKGECDLSKIESIIIDNSDYEVKIIADRYDSDVEEFYFVSIKRPFDDGINGLIRKENELIYILNSSYIDYKPKLDLFYGLLIK